MPQETYQVNVSVSFDLFVSVYAEDESAAIQKAARLNWKVTTDTDVDMEILQIKNAVSGT